MFDERQLDHLRECVKATLSPHRFLHTCGVEETTAEMAAWYCPKLQGALRAAAILHDVTKELPVEEQRAILKRYGIVLRPDEEAAPQIFHGITASLLVPQRYPTFASPEVISAIRWHTTGRAGMTLVEAILFLSDYIEKGRIQGPCVALRKQFFDAHPEGMSHDERLSHLQKTVLACVENTIAYLSERQKPVCLDTIAAKRELQHKVMWRE